MSSFRTRGVAVVLAAALLGLGLSACTGSDNGGVIDIPPPTTTTTVVGATTTTSLPAGSLPGGTLPNS